VGAAAPARLQLARRQFRAGRFEHPPSHVDQAGAAKHAQMPRQPGGRQRQRFGQFAGAQRPAPQQLHHRTPLAVLDAAAFALDLQPQLEAEGVAQPVEIVGSSG
jgi:hypothetical protein